MTNLDLDSRGRGIAIDPFRAGDAAAPARLAVAAECDLDTPAPLGLLAGQGLVATGEAVDDAPPLGDGPVRTGVLRLDRAAREGAR